MKVEMNRIQYCYSKVDTMKSCNNRRMGKNLNKYNSFIGQISIVLNLKSINLSKKHNFMDLTQNKKTNKHQEATINKTESQISREKDKI